MAKANKFAKKRAKSQRRGRGPTPRAPGPPPIPPGGRRAGRGGGTSKTEFVLSLDPAMSPKAVVAAAKEKGFVLSANYVSNIRSNARRKPSARVSARRAATAKQTKPRSGSGTGSAATPKTKRGASPRSGSKTAFVLAQPRTASAKEIVASGKAQGLALTEAYIYGIRSRADRAARRSGLSTNTGARPGRKASGGEGNAEQDLVRAIIAVGTARARQVLDHVEREVSRIQAPR